MTELRTVADVRLMLRGGKTGAGESLPPPPSPNTPDAIPDGAVTVETVFEQPLKTVETVQTFTAGVGVPRQPLAGLGLTTEQQSVLAGLGITDRAALAAALEAAGDKGFAGLSRTQVRALRRVLAEAAAAVPAVADAGRKTAAVSTGSGAGQARAVPAPMAGQAADR